MLPDNWISRIFDHLSGLYGSRFADLWRGADPEIVRRMWAEKLSGFQDMPGAIKEALSALDSKPNPPTLPEFLELCREAARRHSHDTPKLEHKPTHEELQRAEEARIRANETMKAVSAAKNPRKWIDDLMSREANGERLSVLQKNAIREARRVELL